VLIAVAVARFDEGEAGQGVVLQVGVVLRERGDVIRIDAEGVGGIAHDAGGLRGSGAGGAGGVLVEVFGGTGEGREVGSGETSRTVGTAAFGEALALGDGVVDLPRNVRLVEFFKDIRDIELRVEVIEYL